MDFVNKCCNEHGSAHTSSWSCFQFLLDVYREMGLLDSLFSSFWWTSILFSLHIQNVHFHQQGIYLVSSSPTCLQILIIPFLFLSMWRNWNQHSLLVEMRRLVCNENMEVHQNKSLVQQSISQPIKTETRSWEAMCTPDCSGLVTRHEIRLNIHHRWWLKMCDTCTHTCTHTQWDVQP